MAFDTSKLEWTRRPKDFAVSENRITITTQPHDGQQPDEEV